jgi:lipid-A-disaccharide synthase
MPINSKILVLAGEASGDKHSIYVINTMRQLYPQAVLYGVGGHFMENLGVQLLWNIDSLGFMGFSGIATALQRLSHYKFYLEQWIAFHQPCWVVCIDFSGFHLPLVSICQNIGVKVWYHIPPKTWASFPSRASKLLGCDLLTTVYPFETELYAKQGLTVPFVGNILLESTNQNTQNISMPSNPKINPSVRSPKYSVLALVGSRKSEIEQHLFIFLDAGQLLLDQDPSFTMLFVLSENTNQVFFTRLLEAYSAKHKQTLPKKQILDCITIQQGNLAEACRHSGFGFVVSGTVCLEAAFWQLPQVVAYKTTPLNYYIAKRFIQVPYISLINLLFNRPVVAELLQHECTPQNLLRYYNDSVYRNQVQQTLADIPSMFSSYAIIDTNLTNNL